MECYFVTGTNTEVGKTIFSGLYARYLMEKGKSVLYVKPVQTGWPEDDDARTVRKISGLGRNQTLLLNTAAEPVSPCFVFDPFPYCATVERIQELKQAAAYDVMLVESAGGLLVPLGPDEDGADRFNWHFARDLALPTILVVPNRLGCLNDAQLSAFFLEKNRMALKVLAVNGHYAGDSLNAGRNVAMLQYCIPDTEYLYFVDNVVENRTVSED